MTDAPPRPIFVVAPDKFKGTLTAREAAEAMAAGIREAVPGAEIRTIPMADGGEGTVDAAVAAGAELRSAWVSGPLGQPVDAAWALLGGTAIIESAQACGLHLVTPSADSALDATTAGVGELILAAVEAGAERIVVGLGGSASTDGGVGALRALGARTLADSGDEVTGGGRTLAEIARIDLAGLDPRLSGRRILLASDVANPFSGPDGAARVFAPQKGADPEGVERLDAGLVRLAAALRSASGIDLDRSGPDGSAWGGAAGGLAGGLRAALGAEPVSGADELADLLGLDAALEGAALLIVGEGAIDRQTALGKAPVALARRARDRGIRVLAVAGRSELAPTELAADGVAYIATAAAWAGSDAAARQDAARWVALATRQSIAGVPAPAPKESPVPVTPTPYFHFLRTPRNRWWRSLLFILALVFAFILLQTIAIGIAIGVDIATGRTDPTALLRDSARGTITFTPAIFLANNISLAALVPAGYLLQWAFTRQRPRWLSSVAGGIRWRWLLICLAVVLPLWILYIVGDGLINGGLEFGRISPDAWFLLVVVLLTTPLQAMGEEVAFRGALTRSVASWIPRPWVAWTAGTIVSSIVFMFAHSAGDPWLNAFYLSFGIAMSVLAWATGGLEAGIVIHAVNNTLAFIPTVLFGDVSKAFERQAGAGNASVLIGIVVMMVVMSALILLGRRRGIARLGPPDVTTQPVPSAG